ncbi:MAG: TolB family protein [Nocardioidaceae bacterium]
MTSRDDQLGPTLRAVLLEEAKQMQIDTSDAAARLQRELPAVGRRHRRQVATAIAAGVASAAAVAATIVVAGHTNDDSAPTPPADSAAPLPAGDATQPFYFDLDTGDVTPIGSGPIGDLLNRAQFRLSPDGERLVWWTCGGEGCSAEDDMGMARLDGSSVTTWRLPRGLKGYNANWSADGMKVVYQLRSSPSRNFGALYVRDLTTGTDTRVANLRSEPAKSASLWDWNVRPSLSPDGKRVLYPLPRAEAPFTRFNVWSVPITGGEPELELRRASDSLVEYLPDGRIAYMSGSAGEGRRLMAIDEGGARRTLATAPVIGSTWIEASADGSKIAIEAAESPLLTGTINVVDLATGETAQVAFGEDAQWVDDHTLLVLPE